MLVGVNTVSSTVLKLICNIVILVHLWLYGGAG